MADTKLTRIGIFYDGGYFAHVSDYYLHHHERHARISIQGLHALIRDEVGKREQTEARLLPESSRRTTFAAVFPPPTRVGTTSNGPMAMATARCIGSASSRTP